MFKPKTDRIKELAQKYPERIAELEKICAAKTNIYIDYSNVRPWANKLGWHIDLQRLKQLFDSFDTIQKARLYHGTLIGDARSEELAKNVQDLGYDLGTKPVKIMRLSIDVSSVSRNSPDILKNFVRPSLLQNLNLATIEFLNGELEKLNKQGKLYLEDRKCNFDVEIGRDMLIDYERNGVETFILWSGDSDFADPISQLLKDNKKVYVFATARRIAAELNELKKKGLVVYDIQKIRNFICWKKEMQA